MPTTEETPEVSTSNASINQVNPLPIKFYPVDAIQNAPMEKPAEPSPCQPTYFQLADIPAWAKDYKSFRWDIKSKNVLVSVWTPEELESNPLTPFSLREFEFSADDCRSKALAIYKDGKFYALYTHIDEYSINPVRKEMLLHSTVLENGAWKERRRRIDLETKNVRVLPLDDCFSGFLQHDGSIYFSGMKPEENAPTVSCQINPEGSVLFKMHPVGVGGTSLFVMPADTARKLLLAIDINSAITKAFSDANALLVFDLTDPERFAVMKMPRSITTYIYGKTIMFDVSRFSFEDPQILMQYRESEEKEWQEMLLLEIS